MNPQELLEKINGTPADQENGDRYQKQFGELIAREMPKVVVETGVHYGVSTAFILNALQPGAVLHSCDPAPLVELEHPQFKLWKMKSVEALPKIFLQTGPWDVFLHDSDHGAECQTFEYELAWHCVRNGGIIATDDPVWGHHASWKIFCDRHNIKTKKLMSADYIVKVGDPIMPGQLDETMRMCVEMGRQVAGML